MNKERNKQRKVAGASQLIWKRFMCRKSGETWRMIINLVDGGGAGGV